VEETDKLSLIIAIPTYLLLTLMRELNKRKLALRNTKVDMLFSTIL